MRRVVSIVAGAAVALLVAGASTAQSAPVQYNWTGFYLGANGGGSWLDTNSKQNVISGPGTLSVPTGTALYGGTLNASPDADGDAFIGAQFGYNWQFAPTWVAGFEADIQSGTKGTKNCIITCNEPIQIAPGILPFFFPVVLDENSYTVDINWLATFRARLGYTYGPALFYLTGGLAVGDVERRGSVNGVTTFFGIFPINGFAGSFSSSSVKTGWTLGLGVEGQLTSNLSLKAEYLYVDLGSVTDRFDTNFTGGIGFGPGSAATRTIRSDIREQIVRVGLNYHFTTGTP